MAVCLATASGVVVSLSQAIQCMYLTTKMAFTAEEDQILVDTVADNPILYDSKLESYRDGHKKLNVWEGIAGILNKTAEECKKRWKHIKDSYNRYKRKRKAGTGSSAVPKNSKWEFYERLQFLDVLACHRKGISDVPDLKQERPKESIETANNERDSNNSYTDGTDDELEEHYNTHLTEANIVNETERDHHISQENTTNTTQTSSQQDTTRVTKVAQRKKIRSKQNEVLPYMRERDIQRQASLQNAVAENVPTNVYDDDVSSFGDHIKSVLRKLPPILKVKAKTEIFNIMSKYELLAMETPDVSRATSSNSNYSTYIIPSPVHASELTHQDTSGNEYSNNVPSTIFNNMDYQG